MICAFTICRVADYADVLLFSADELAAGRYVVSVNNGDDHLCATVLEVLELIDDELWLAGFSDEEATE